MADTTPAKASLTWAQAFVSGLGILKETLLTVMSFLIQYERIKAKKTEDELILLKADKNADDAQKAIQSKADSTDPRRGIDDFLQR